MPPTDPAESVWDYPRPPRLEPTARRLRVLHHGVLIADTTDAMRILETSHPPVFYLPQSAIEMQFLRQSPRRSTFCEFKGHATYWSIDVSAAAPGPGALSPDAAWSYPNPTPAYAALRDYLAFYATRVDECTVDGEPVSPQPGDFYGGWITSHVKGPFKGPPGTLGW